ncbi:hypothetical protein NW762_010750 [Fusarium torreyae]|uniref:ribonuclease H n=1 Tax=Fusarium torreyae TaxID=1237075 RepID=A0A9W8VD06_9HYPO|nr:hypothetical protein NW762_010750 [Fusarium torreyae]
MPKFYAIRVGRETGIFENWDDCKHLVKKFRGAEHKSFSSEEEAQAFMNKRTESSRQLPLGNVSPEKLSAIRRSRVGQGKRRESDILLIKQRLTTLNVGDVMAIIRSQEGFNFSITAAQTVSEKDESDLVLVSD